MESSMEDVAELAGVSVTTVSRALRQSPLVSATTTARVLAAADQLSFAVSRTASSLATGRLGRIGVLVSGRISAWFNGSILDGIYATLREADVELLIYRITDTSERGTFFETLPARRNADALIVASFALSNQEQERLQALGMPLVYLNQTVAGAQSVSIDDAAGTRMGVRHLLNLGHRRIAYVQAENRAGFFYSAEHRIDGFRAELVDAGIGPSDQVVVKARSFTDGEQVVAQFLSLSPLPTALIVDSDELAMSILSACSRVGVRTPEDVSVLGFDDHAMAVTFGLSTVAQPVDRLGREAAALALSLVRAQSSMLLPSVASMATADGQGRLEVTVPTELVLRHSTARPRETDRLTHPTHTPTV